MFDPAFPVAKLHGAAYNPRVIAPDDLALLRASLEELGVLKPIIATADGLIMAGHQRTTVLRMLGWEHVPVYVVDGIDVTSEVRFNQLHNGTDMDQIDHPIRILSAGPVGYQDVPTVDIEGNNRSSGAGIRQEIMKMILRYGPWGCAVVSTSGGDVISGHQYALACRILDIPCRVCRVPDELIGKAAAVFGRTYGEFSYSALPKRTWIQSLAQPRRITGKRLNYSVLYKKDVIPKLQKTERIIDFGCGKADHIRLLARQGFDTQAIEFYHSGDRGNEINPALVHRMIDSALASWAEFGGFDVVVLDSVLTSIDSLQAQSDVLAVVNALARPGARIHLAGRRLEQIEKNTNTTITGRVDYTTRSIEFLDKDGFSAFYRAGEWFYQKFHTAADVRHLIETYIGEFGHYAPGGDMWRAGATKTVELPDDVVEAALRREFDLPWPEGRSVGRADEAVAAWKAAKIVDANRKRC